MALTQYKVVTGSDPDALERNVLEAATAGLLPVGDVQYDMDARLFMLTMAVGDVYATGNPESMSVVVAQDLGGLAREVLLKNTVLYGPAQWNMDMRMYIQPMVAAGSGSGGA